MNDLSSTPNQAPSSDSAPSDDDFQFLSYDFPDEPTEEARKEEGERTARTIFTEIQKAHQRAKEFDTGPRPLRPISPGQYARACALLYKIDAAVQRLCDEPLSLDDVTLDIIYRLHEYMHLAFSKLDTQPISHPE